MSIRLIFSDVMGARFLKFLVAVILLPLAVGEIRALIDLAWMSAPAGEWRETWFASLCAGFVTWLIIFFLLPRTMWLYVLGHEFTHALAAMLAGGKVSGFQVTAKGGHVMTDRVNWWIALSPYFVPIYALIWMGLWLTVDFYYPLKAWQPILYFGIGLFWSFHLTFTVSMLHRRQTDLSGEGYLFSSVIILTINLVIVLLLLSFLTHDGIVGAFRLLGWRVGQTYAWSYHEITEGIAYLRASWQRHHF